MVYKSFRLGGLKLSVNADRAGAGVAISFSGGAWNSFVNKVRGPRPPAADAQAQTMPAAAAKAPSTLEEEVASQYWYHTIDLGNGLRTPGQFDHGPLIDRYQLPTSLAGKRVLDVATFDGFWAFEFERRGAAEVIALDLDKPADLDWQPALLARATPEQLAVRFGKGFELAKRELKSKVQRVACNVYDLHPDKFGMFDIVHAGDFLLHINSPVKALQNMAHVCREYAIISDVYFPELEHFGGMPLMEYRGGRDDVTWWRFSLAALQQMVKDAGFSRVELVTTFRYGQRNMPENMHHAVLKAYK
ncbi:class I SAM-dependent methyltransferase [Piscinibacter terrae]|nr:class I SAM-dependent methyltransferase [Albitalea terrae]